MWWRKTEVIKSDEFETLLKRLVLLEARVDYLEANEDNLRNMARKIQKKKIIEPDIPETEDSKRSVLVLE